MERQIKKALRKSLNFLLKAIAVAVIFGDAFHAE
jgi:hypothetical protein